MVEKTSFTNGGWGQGGQVKNVYIKNFLCHSLSTGYCSGHHLKGYDWTKKEIYKIQDRKKIVAEKTL